MKNLVLCTTLNFLILVNFVYCVEVTPHQPSISFHTKSSFNLTCNVSFDNSDKPNIQWFKESKKVTDIDNLKSRSTQKWIQNANTLTVQESQSSDAGNYSCVVYEGGEEKARANISASVAKTVAVRVPDNINVVEEERLRIECEVVGDPKLFWIFENETYTTSRDRVILENNTVDGKVIVNAFFVIERITNEDRGEVTCVGEDLVTGKTYQDNCMVRIKGKYAALWPFLGICAEVIVLCAIIVIYEKKRNKTELEESDTDQSPDQKNTPDHGKDANLRHRQ